MVSGPNGVPGAKAAHEGAIVYGYSMARITGVLATTCRLAASEIGPAQTWGTTRAPK